MAPFDGPASMVLLGVIGLHDGVAIARWHGYRVSGVVRCDAVTGAFSAHLRVAKLLFGLFGCIARDIGCVQGAWSGLGYICLDFNDFRREKPPPHRPYPRRWRRNRRILPCNKLYELSRPFARSRPKYLAPEFPVLSTNIPLEVICFSADS